jgi:hypothetical protein
MISLSLIFLLVAGLLIFLVAGVPIAFALVLADL